MSNQRYPEEFKIEAVKQRTERGRPVAEVAARLGSLYAWIKRDSKPQAQRAQEDDQQAELRRMRAELKRVTEERDILKRPPDALPRSAAEVRLHQSIVGGLLGSSSLLDAESAPQWLLRVAGRAKVSAGQA